MSAGSSLPGSKPSARMTSCKRLRIVGYERPISCSMRLILPSQRTKVNTNSICSGVRIVNCPETNWPSRVVSHDEQCKRVTVNSDWQMGQRVGAGLIKDFLQN